MYSMEKLAVLLKIAVSFGDTRNLLMDLKSKGVTVKRNQSFLMGKIFKRKTPYTEYSPKVDGKKIGILKKLYYAISDPKKIFNTTEKETSIYIPRGKSYGMNPTTTLFHETGHVYSQQKRPYGKILEKSNGRLLKDERMANRAALQHITNPKDREAYIKEIETGYKTYKRHFNIKEFEKNKEQNKRKYYNGRHFKSIVLPTLLKKNYNV